MIAGPPSSAYARSIRESPEVVSDVEARQDGRPFVGIWPGRKRGEIALPPIQDQGEEENDEQQDKEKTEI